MPFVDAVKENHTCTKVRYLLSFYGNAASLLLESVENDKLNMSEMDLNIFNLHPTCRRKT